MICMDHHTQSRQVTLRGLSAKADRQDGRRKHRLLGIAGIALLVAIAFQFGVHTTIASILS